MLAKFSVKKPLTVIMALCMVVLLGYVSFTNMTTDLLPNMEMPYVAVIVTYPGAAPEEVELSLTKPLEQTLSTVSGLKNCTSVSNENYCMILLEFSQDINLDSCMIEMSSNVDSAMSALDDSVGSPIYMKINPDMIPLLIASVNVDGADLYSASSEVDSIVIPALERVEGVASVNTVGALEKYVLITLNDDKIDALNKQVLDAVDKTLADAEKKITDGEKELEKGKAELESAKTSTATELANATAMMSDGLMRIQTGMSSITAAKTQLDTYISLLSTVQTYVDKAFKNVDTYEKYVDKLSEYMSLLDSALTSAMEALDDAYNALPKNAGIIKDALSGIQDSVSKALDKCQRVIKALEENSPKKVYSRITELIKSTTDSFKETQATLESTYAELETQYKNLQTQQIALEQGKLEFAIKMADASTQLTLAESALTAARTQFESAKDSAYEKANLSGAITSGTISALLNAENFSMPAGSVSQDKTTYAVKVGDKYESDKDMLSCALFNIPAGDIGTITLEDVADVAYMDNSSELYAKVNGSDGLFLTLQKQSTYSTTDVAHRVQRAIKDIESANPAIHITALSDQGDYIDLVINAVLQNLLFGGVLAIIILLLFLRNIKPTLVVAISIPASLLASVVMMYFTGVTLNIISLSGLALGVGMLVDNSIVVIENIYRMRSLGVPVKEAAIKGATQVAGAITASTLTTISVFLPIVFTQGITKQLFTDMGLTIAFSLVSSLVVALTLVPTLSVPMLNSMKEQKPTRIGNAILSGYGKVLAFSLKHKIVPIALVLALLALSVFGAFNMGTEFVPESDMAQMSVTLEAPIGTSVDDTRALCDELITRLTAIDDVDTIAAMQSTGASTSLLALSSGGDNTVSLYLLLKAERQHSSNEVSQIITNATADMPCTITVATATMSLSMLTGTGLEVVVTGDDIDTLISLADDCAALLESLEGTENVSNGRKEAAQEIRITVDKARAMEYNLTVAQVYMKIAAALSDKNEATTVSVANEDMPVIVAKSASNVLSADTLADFEISVSVMNDDGEAEDKLIKLSDIASITYADTLASISHTNRIRTLSVTAGIDANHNVGKVGEELERRLGEIAVPDGYSVKLAGESTYISDALGDLWIMVLMAVAFIYMIMVAQFQSLKSPFIVMFTIPLAFTGGLLALWIFGFNLSVVAMLGFLVLSGVVVNNGIVFVDYANQLVSEGKSKLEALVETGKTRMRPIFMTALTTILSLSTLGLAIGDGADMMQPMAVTVIFGLTYATVLTLFIIPVLYDIFNKDKKQTVPAPESPLEPVEQTTDIDM